MENERKTYPNQKTKINQKKPKKIPKKSEPNLGGNKVSKKLNTHCRAFKYVFQTEHLINEHSDFI